MCCRQLLNLFFQTQGYRVEIAPLKLRSTIGTIGVDIKYSTDHRIKQVIRTKIPSVFNHLSNQLNL